MCYFSPENVVSKPQYRYITSTNSMLSYDSFLANKVIVTLPFSLSLNSFVLLCFLSFILSFNILLTLVLSSNYQHITQRFFILSFWLQTTLKVLFMDRSNSFNSFCKVSGLLETDPMGGTENSSSKAIA